MNLSGNRNPQIKLQKFKKTVLTSLLQIQLNSTLGL